MDSPVRQQQKRNDYNRHKLFRKINKRRKAKREQEQRIAEKELKRKLKMPRYEDGKTTWNYYDSDGNRVQPTVDADGNVQETINLGGAEPTITPDWNLVKYIRNAFRNVSDDAYYKLLDETSPVNYYPRYYFYNNPNRNRNNIYITNRGYMNAKPELDFGIDYNYDATLDDPNQRIFRLAQLTNISGNPSVYLKTNKNDADEDYYKDKDWYRVQINNDENQMTLANPDIFSGNDGVLAQYLEELPHAFQFHSPYSSWNLRNRIKRNREPFNNDTHSQNLGYGNYESGYEDPGNTEFQAHSIIEPSMWDFLETTISPEYFSKDVMREVQKIEDYNHRYPIQIADSSKYNYINKLGPWKKE